MFSEVWELDTGRTGIAIELIRCILFNNNKLLCNFINSPRSVVNFGLCKLLQDTKNLPHVLLASRIYQQEVCLQCHNMRGICCYVFNSFVELQQQIR